MAFLEERFSSAKRKEFQPLKSVEIGSPLELLYQSVETERLETIPLYKIHTDTDETIIDDYHAEDLGASMRGKRGQITPIAVRARLVDTDQITYDIIDGFHRTIGLKRHEKDNPNASIRANVLYGATDEELFDLRILAASSVRSVQFPRVAKWVKKAYDATPFAEKGMSVTRAFAFTYGNGQRTNVPDFTREDASELKKWVNDKCRRWQTSVTSMRRILEITENADPELVKQVRTFSGGKDREGKITPTRLEVVANSFPGEEHYQVQHVLITFITQHRLSTKEARQLASVANPLISEKEKEFGRKLTPGEITNIAVSIPLGSAEPKVATSVFAKTTSASEGGLGVTVVTKKKLDQLSHEQDLVKELSEKQSELNTARSTIYELEQRVKTAEIKAGMVVFEYNKKISKLEEKVRIAQAKTRKDYPANLVSGGASWIEQDHISPQERDLLRRILDGGQTLDEIGAVMRMPAKLLLSTLASALVRNSIARQAEIIKTNEQLTIKKDDIVK